MFVIININYLKYAWTAPNRIHVKTCRPKSAHINVWWTQGTLMNHACVMEDWNVLCGKRAKCDTAFTNKSKSLIPLADFLYGVKNISPKMLILRKKILVTTRIFSQTKINLLFQKLSRTDYFSCKTENRAFF